MLGSIIYYFVGSSKDKDGEKTHCFHFFTNDSNIFVGISSLILIPYNVFKLKETKRQIPLKSLVLKFLGTVSVIVTFLTVVFFLVQSLETGKDFLGVIGVFCI